MTTYKFLIINPVLINVKTATSAVGGLPISIIAAQIDKPYELIDTGIEIKKVGWLRRNLKKLI